MTHASIPAKKREDLGITEGLVRLSCGVEEGDNLIRGSERTFGEGKLRLLCVC